MEIELQKYQFEEFMFAVKFWREYLKIYDYEIVCELDDLDEYARAMCVSNQEAKICILSLNKMWHYDPTVKEIHKCSFHELFELILADLREGSIYNQSLTDISIHTVIKRFENIMFEEIYNKEFEGRAFNEKNQRKEI